MSVGTVLSRITGLLRVAAIVAALGVAESRLADTYNLANTAPLIIYELILGGVLSSVFVPVFVELLEKEGNERAWEVASAIINMSLVVLAAVTIIGIVAAPALARLYTIGVPASDVEAQRRVLTFLLRVFTPQIIFYGLAALISGLLNAHKRFGAPMFTPVLNNLAVIGIFVAFHQAYPSAAAVGEVSTTQLWIIGAGTTAGVVLMAVAQLPFLRGLGRFRPSLNLRHPAVRQLGKLSVFLVGYAVTNQIGYFIVQVLAAGDQGGYAAYVTAFTFYMLPHGLFAVSIITALLPGMSEHAVNDRWDEFRGRLSTGVRTTSLLIFPAAVGYFVLGEPIIRFMLERGVMSAASTNIVAGVLQWFVVGLLPFSLFQLFLRAFYSMQDSKTPFLINCGAVTLNTAANFPLFHFFGVRGLAAGHALAYTFGSVLQARALSRRIGGLDGRRIINSLIRILGAAGAMGALVWFTSQALESVLDSRSFVGGALAVLVPVAVGALAYIVFASALRVEELAYARSLVSRRLRRGEDKRESGR
jgi:putative peptidoglycan lipid II flippase